MSNRWVGRLRGGFRKVRVEDVSPADHRTDFWKQARASGRPDPKAGGSDETPCCVLCAAVHMSGSGSTQGYACMHAGPPEKYKKRAGRRATCMCAPKDGVVSNAQGPMFRPAGAERSVGWGLTQGLIEIG